MERLHRWIAGLVAFAAVTIFLSCSKKTSSSSGREGDCRTQQPLQAEGLRGARMQPKQIALTFDDGPGPRTKALSAFLKNEGIQAAFFVNGRSLGENAAEILQQLVDDGHIIGNHTETHRSLTGVTTQTPRPTDAEIIQELAETDAKIAPFVKGDRFLFRPPFGDYDEQTFETLATSPMNKYVGPVLWDVGDRMDEAAGEVADWDCWQDGTDGKRLTVQECGDLYITAIKRAGWGIVLLHDPYFNEDDPMQEGTVEMVMYMVPILKQEGFSFVRVDQVPEIAALLPPLPPDRPADPGVVPVEPADGPAPSELEDPCK